MLDILGGMALTALAILCFGTLALAGAGDPAWRGRLAGIGIAWLAAIAALAGLGLFSRTGGLGIIALSAVVFAPIIAGGIALARSPRVRSFASGIPLAVLVGVHVGRLLGGFFVALYQAGRMPATFALTAGTGDLFIGLTALPLAWAIQRRVNGWRRLALAWNALGALDLATALTLGVGSAAGSPMRFLFETPDSGAVGVLPWALIPGILVPLYMLTHVAIFSRLAAHARGEERMTLPHAA
jgi:hypothetical protein